MTVCSHLGIFRNSSVYLCIHVKFICEISMSPPQMISSLNFWIKWGERSLGAFFKWATHVVHSIFRCKHTPEKHRSGDGSWWAHNNAHSPRVVLISSSLSSNRNWNDEISYIFFVQCMKCLKKEWNKIEKMPLNLLRR